MLSAYYLANVVEPMRFHFAEFADLYWPLAQMMTSARAINY